MKPAKLTRLEVKQIRHMRESSKMTVPQIHKYFPQVSVWCIYKVVSYYSWPMVR
jgi:uncharacterized protein (DUF433 family)